MRLVPQRLWNKEGGLIPSHRAHKHSEVILPVSSPLIDEIFHQLLFLFLSIYKSPQFFLSKEVNKQNPCMLSLSLWEQHTCRHANIKLHSKPLRCVSLTHDLHGNLEGGLCVLVGMWARKVQDVISAEQMAAKAAFFSSVSVDQLKARECDFSYNGSGLSFDP